jgi:hypothetical protein
MTEDDAPPKTACLVLPLCVHHRLKLQRGLSQRFPHQRASATYKSSPALPELEQIHRAVAAYKSGPADLPEIIATERMALN